MPPLRLGMEPEQAPAAPSRPEVTNRWPSPAQAANRQPQKLPTPRMLEVQWQQTMGTAVPVEHMAECQYRRATLQAFLPVLQE